MTATLYERLGKSTGIRAIVDDIFAAHLVNTPINKRYLPLLDDPEKKETVLQHLADFLEMGAGGPAEYRGMSMPDTHKGMNITAEEYMAVTDDIMNTLVKHDIDDATRLEVLGIVYSIKGDIIRL